MKIFYYHQCPYFSLQKMKGSSWDPLGMAVCGSVSQLLPWACFRCQRVKYNTRAHGLAPKSQATALNWAISQVTSSTSHCLFWSSLKVLSFLSPEPFPPPQKHTLSSELSKMCHCVFSSLSLEMLQSLCYSFAWVSPVRRWKTLRWLRATELRGSKKRLHFPPQKRSNRTTWRV